MAVESCKPCGLLEQGGNAAQVPGAYVEFAERLPLPQYASLEHVDELQRRDGFETSNADRIFESTYLRKTQ